MNDKKMPTGADTPTAGNTDSADFPTESGKRESTLLAQFALHGHTVHHADDGGYLVCHGALCRYCPDMAALSAFAKQVGATR